MAARIASSRAIIITILVANVEGAVERVTQEVARSMNEETVADEVDIRCVNAYLTSLIDVTHEQPLSC